MATQPERIASLEAHKTWYWKALTAVTVLFIAWLSWVSVTLVSQVGDIRAIKQRLADGGLGSIIASLQNPSSPGQLAANLALVWSSIRVQREEGKTPDQARLAKLSSAVKTAAVQNPNVVEAWQASFELVSYRFNAPPRSFAVGLPNCLESQEARRQMEQMLKAPPPKRPEQEHALLFLSVSNCSIDLDDDGSYSRTSVGRFFEAMQKLVPQTNFNGLKVINGVVTYSGAKFLPLDQIQFENCKFDLREPSAVPPPNGRSLASQLLTAKDDRNVTFSISKDSGI